MSVCDKVIAPANTGDYELKVTQEGTTDTVQGARGINGHEVEKWTHQNLIENGPQRFTVNSGERHNVQVFGTFQNDDTFTVELHHGGAVVATCVLTRDGDTSSNMDLITRAEAE